MENSDLVRVNVSLRTTEQRIVDTYATQHYDNNFSAGLRAIIRHFGQCQFPLLGINAVDVPEMGTAAAIPETVD